MVLAAVLLAAALVWRFLLNRNFREVLFAGLRAFVQLAIVALLIAQLSSHPALALVFIALMFCIAVWTAGRRIAKTGNWWMAAIPLACGVIPVAALMFCTEVLPWNALALIAVVGQQIGGAMATTTLAGRRIESELQQRRGEVEAAVALGLTWPASRHFISRDIAGEAVLPSIDQARTAGTVTLPGAFVGLILGGASPIAAGQIQLLVLISLLLVNSLAAWACLLLSSSGAWEQRRREKAA